MERPLPADEHEWLVATTFNHAVDLYARGEEEPCHVWALKAMELARCAGADDNGQLATTLERKFAKLRFRSPPRPGRRHRAEDDLGTV